MGAAMGWHGGRKSGWNQRERGAADRKSWSSLHGSNPLAQRILHALPNMQASLNETVVDWSALLSTANDGFCAVTDTPAEKRLACPASGEAKGSWPLLSVWGVTGLAALRLCMAMCVTCKQCHHISFSFADYDCSWFRQCEHYLVSLGGETTGHMTFQIRGRNASDPDPYDRIKRFTIRSVAADWHRRLPHWRQSPLGRSLEFVPSVYEEWGTFDSTWLPPVRGVTPGGFSHPPPWLAMVLPNVTTYQRLKPAEVNYMPNVGLEMGTILHHIVRRYDSLAPLTVFAQADLTADEAASLRCLRPNATWAPISSSLQPRYFLRNDCTWRGWNASLSNKLQCFRQYLHIFGLRWPKRGCPNFYVQNAFVVSESMIRRFPRSTWRRALLETRAAPECVADGTGGERSSNAIFGGQNLTMRAWTDAHWCEQYRAHCAYSPCTGGRLFDKGELHQYS